MKLADELGDKMTDELAEKTADELVVQLAYHVSLFFDRPSPSCRIFTKLCGLAEQLAGKLIGRLAGRRRVS